MKPETPAARPDAPPAAPRRAALLPLGAMLTGMMLCPGLASAAEDGDKTLSTVRVQDERTRESKGLQGGTTRVGKLEQLAKDIPQGLTIVSEQLMEDKNAHTLKEALSNVAGLTFNAGEGGRIGDNMNLRGFYSFGDLYLDGIRDVAQYNRETFNLEQIDVLRGSGSMLFGRGQAGGVINQVSKQAQLYDFGKITGTIGSYDYKRLTADVNQQIADDAAIRINVMKTDAGSSRDYVRSNREGINPTVRWGIGTRDEFSLSYLYLNTQNIADFGVPFVNNRPLDVPANRFYGYLKDLEANNTQMATGTWLHRFSQDTQVRTVLRHANYTRSLWASPPQLRSTYNATTGACAGTPATPSAGIMCRGVQSRGGEEETVTLQTDFSTKFTTGFLKHEVLTGIELLRENAARWTYLRTNPDGSALVRPPTSVDAPNPTSPLLSAAYGNTSINPDTVNSYQGDSIGVYAQDSVEFMPGWKLLFGVRQDSLKADYVFRQGTPVTLTRAKLDFSETSYRSGLMWQPSDYATYYVAWNDSFNPTADLYQLDFGQGFEPERSQTIELGAKWELFEGDLSLRTALYRAEKKWERNTDVESSGGLLSKKRRTDGFELEAAGRLTRQWEVFAGLALMDPKILEQGYSIVNGAAVQQSAALVGMRPRNAPTYTANFWTTYKIEGGWKIGLGADAKGQRYAYGINANAPNPNIAPAYVRWDALVAYEQPKYMVKLNVLNLLDKRYYESIYENGAFTVPGTQRALQLTGEFRF